jgi:hypothetical protein
MGKSRNFSGHPIFKQLLGFIDRGVINRTAKQFNADRYYKRFKTYDHLIAMLFASISGVSSLRELSSVMLACEGKINHLNLKQFPRRSTLSDANRKRTSQVFGAIYYRLLDQYRRFLSDSSPKVSPVAGLKIIDSTTITLFSDILKGAGRQRLNGKKKGGIKIHTMINVLEDVPCLVRFSSAAVQDHKFLQTLQLKKGSFVVFDRGYNDYQLFERWSKHPLFFVTRQKRNASYKQLEILHLTYPDIEEKVLHDQRISVKSDKQHLQLRKVTYWHAPQRKLFEFITNNFELPARTITQIYKQRWQIETMFKRLKQNFPLKYFLGDNQNAIEIQIWVSLILQLLMVVVQRLARRKWAFSTMVSVIRYHLMAYIDLFKFLEHPDKSYEDLTNKPPPQLSLFTSQVPVVFKT